MTELNTEKTTTEEILEKNRQLREQEKEQNMKAHLIGYIDSYYKRTDNFIKLLDDKNNIGRRMLSLRKKKELGELKTNVTKLSGELEKLIVIIDNI